MRTSTFDAIASSSHDLSSGSQRQPTTTPLNAVSGLCTRFARWRAIARAQQDLAQLDAHLLRDIGVEIHRTHNTRRGEHNFLRYYRYG